MCTCICMSINYRLHLCIPIEVHLQYAITTIAYPTLYVGSVQGVPVECGVFDAECSSDLSYCAVHCRGPAVPFSVMMRYENGTFTQGRDLW